MKRIEACVGRVQSEVHESIRKSGPEQAAWHGKFLVLFGTKVAVFFLARIGLIGGEIIGLAAWLWLSEGLEAASSVTFLAFSPLDGLTTQTLGNKSVLVLQLPKSFLII